MDTLDAQRTRARLPYGELAHVLESMLSACSAGRAYAPERTRIALPNAGVLLVMPAADTELAMTKLVTIHPHNDRHALPTIQGEVIVMDARTGMRLGTLDGAAVTERRTAALSLLAARRLAPIKTCPMLVVGAGAQARAHVEAFHEGLGIDTLYIQSRTHRRAAALAEYASTLGMSATVLERIEDAPENVRLFVTATTSRTPVLPENLPPDAFVAAVGAFKPNMAELPPALIASGSVVVDSLDGAQAEAGDLIDAVTAGAFHWEDAWTLETVLAGDTPPLPGPVLFKSVGHSLWDLAAAHLAFAHA